MKPTYTAAEYRAKLIAATVMIRNLALEEYEGAPPMQYNLRGVHLDYALKHLHDVQRMLPKPFAEPSGSMYDLPGVEPTRITAKVIEEFRKNPDPDTALFNFTPHEREHIRSGHYADLRHSCQTCLTIDKIVSGLEL